MCRPWFSSSDRQGRGARTERALHQHRVDPPPEFETDAGQYANMGKAERRVQADRRQGLATADYRDHLAVPELGRLFDNPSEQRPADTASGFAGIDIDRILERKPVADPRPIRPGVAIADHLTLTLGDEIREAARHQIGSASRHLLDAWRHFLERGDAIEYVMAVDRGDPRDIVVARRPDHEFAATHPIITRRSPAADCRRESRRCSRRSADTSRGSS